MRVISKTTVALLALTGAAQANAACERHVYNNTDFVWFIEYVPGQTSPSGSLYFGDFCGDVRNGSCVLPPHSVMTITYTTTGGVTSIDLGIRDPTGQEFVFPAYATGSACPVLQHEGDTGGASVNDPANGDVTISSYAWDTSVTPPPPPPNGSGGPGVSGSDHPDMRTKPMPATPPANSEKTLAVP